MNINRNQATMSHFFLVILNKNFNLSSLEGLNLLFLTDNLSSLWKNQKITARSRWVDFLYFIQEMKKKNEQAQFKSADMSHMTSEMMWAIQQISICGRLFTELIYAHCKRWCGEVKRRNQHIFEHYLFIYRLIGYRPYTCQSTFRTPSIWYWLGPRDVAVRCQSHKITKLFSLLKSFTP